MLLGAIVAIALVMIALSVALVDTAFELRREREVESMHRANQYVRAVREYYLKFGRYPGSIEQLENTNNIRFLRKKYVDPLTGKADYRLIIVGQNKTTPKGFFGEPLSGLPGGGLGGATGTSGAAGTGGTSTSGLPGGVSGILGSLGLGGGTGVTGGTNVPPALVGPPGAQTTPQTVSTTTDTGSAATGGAAGTGTAGSGTGSGLTGAGAPGSNIGPIMGVGSSASGNSILTVNEQNTYQTWEFLYDPREELLRQQGRLNSGASSTGMGQNPAGLGGAGSTGAFGSGGGTGSGSGTNAPAGTAPAGGTTQPAP